MRIGGTDRVGWRLALTGYGICIPGAEWPALGGYLRNSMNRVYISKSSLCPVVERQFARSFSSLDFCYDPSPTMYLLKPLALLGGLAAYATAEPIIEWASSTFVARPATPTIPPEEVAKFTATMKVNEDKTKCYIELNMAAIGCVDKTSDLIDYGYPWPHACHGEGKPESTSNPPIFPRSNKSVSFSQLWCYQ